MTAVDPGIDQDTITVHNPADGRVVGSVPIDGSETVAAKARELRLFQSEWEEMGPRGRKKPMMAWQDWVLDNADHLTEVLMSETGKSRRDASIEPITIADAIKYWAGNAEEFLADRHPKAHSPLFAVKKLTTIFRPYPLVGMIEPWNFPLAMLALDLVPALASGAAVLLKPSEVTPLSAVELARGWNEVGAPPIFALATGYGATGASVIENSDYVHFTGSTATGRKVAVACAERLI
ncbi:aldehyde dehydrogenase family protein, partial [Mycolicibacterium sp.]|uniref:aldehyde dehydrogenase family protein n=1 Tax=Mycolicibacterium sp. TaxID=2320850 RepID=UPI001A2C5018